MTRGIAFSLVSVALLGTSTPAGADEDRWFAADKAQHVAVTTGLGAGGYWVGALVFERRDRRVVVGLATALGAGAAKEWRDRSRGGTASSRDLTWDAVGAATGVTVAWLIDRARHARRRDHATRPEPSAERVYPRPAIAR